MLKKEEIIEILSPLNFWGRTQEIGIERKDYLKKLDELSQSKNAVLAVIGVRRAGKTYLCRQWLNLKCKNLPESTLYVLLEDPKFEPYLSVNFLDEIYQAYRSYVYREGLSFLVFDEIQNVNLWEKWVRAELEKKENIKIIITGSSAKLLSSELATLLTGRSLTLNVFPLDFKEFLAFKNLELDYKKKYKLISKKEEIERFLIEYITYGGFPQIVIEEKHFLKEQLLKEIFEGIIYRDVVFRHKIRDAYLVKVIAELAISNFSNLLSANRLRNVLVKILGRKISPNFVVETLEFLKEAFLIFQLPIFSYKPKDYKLYPQKVYCIDTGLINVVFPRFTKDLGRLYENVVALYLLRQKGINNLFYWKKEDYEVDFVVKEDVKVKKLIQVCYDLRNEKTKKREVNALIKASRDLKVSELLIITSDYEGKEKIQEKTIRFIPLWKWLLLNSD